MHQKVRELISLSLHKDLTRGRGGRGEGVNLKRKAAAPITHILHRETSCIMNAER